RSRQQSLARGDAFSCTLPRQLSAYIDGEREDEGRACERARTGAARHPATATEAERGAGEGAGRRTQPRRSCHRARHPARQPWRDRRAGWGRVGGGGGGGRGGGE